MFKQGTATSQPQLPVVNPGLSGACQELFVLDSAWIDLCADNGSPRLGHLIQEKSQAPAGFLGAARGGEARVHPCEPLENAGPGKSTLERWEGIAVLVLLGLGASHPPALPGAASLFWFLAFWEFWPPGLDVLDGTLLVQ